MMSRVTQVLYTATSQNPGARVWISVEGRALEVLGGEGLILDQPLTRASFVPSFQLPVGAGNPEGLRPPNGVAKASPSDNGFLRRKP
jgi:hypothetical protein